MQHIRRVLLLVVAMATVGAFGLAGANSAGASYLGASRPDSSTSPSYVSGYRPDRAGPSDSIGPAYHNCWHYWINSGHTDNVRWYHCHDTAYANEKRVHICGYSGYLHGISVIDYLNGYFGTYNHRHDYGGEGC
jgi:hypothetical protein